MRRHFISSFALLIAVELGSPRGAGRTRTAGRRQQPGAVERGWSWRRRHDGRARQQRGRRVETWFAARRAK